MIRAVLTLPLVAALAGGAAADSGAPPPGPFSVAFAATGTHQFAAGLHGGGEARCTAANVGGGVTWRPHPAFSAGVSLRYAREEWRFGAGSAIGGPWRLVHRPSVALNARVALSRSTLLGLSPAAEWAFDARAGSGDAMTYGGVVSIARVFTPRLVLGGGASVTRQFYSVKVSPFVIVDWRVTDRFRIANAIPAGPEGGAGVELRFVPRPGWELAAGGVSRSDRLRLPAGGASSVGVVDGVPLLARVSRELGRSARVDAYAGAVVNGRLSVRDGDGDETAHDGLDAAPAVALTLAFRR